jgi:hypothetical protein
MRLITQHEKKMYQCIRLFQGHSAGSIALVFRIA